MGNLTYSPVPGQTGLVGDVDAVIPFAGGEYGAGVQKAGSAFFLQQGITRWWDSSSSLHNDLRHGLVYRFRTSDEPDANIIGVSMFHLSNFEQGHEVLVPVVDYIGRWGTASFRYFSPTTDWRTISAEQMERALEGMELAMGVDVTSTVRLNAAGYRWESEDGSGQWTKGVRLGLGWRPTPWLNLSTGYDNMTGGEDALSFLAGVRIPLGGQSKPPRWEGLGLAAGGSAPDTTDLWRPTEGVGQIRVATRTTVGHLVSNAEVRFLQDTVSSGGVVQLEIVLPAAAPRDIHVVVRLVPGSGNSPTVPGEDFVDEPLETTIAKRCQEGSGIRTAASQCGLARRPNPWRYSICSFVMSLFAVCANNEGLKLNRGRIHAGSGPMRRAETAKTTFLILAALLVTLGLSACGGGGGNGTQPSAPPSAPPEIVVTPPDAAPDLMVESVMASDSSLGVGGSFTLSATVGNGGDGPSSATTLRYYRSTDATITVSDTAVGTDAVGALAASGTSAQSISLTAPLSAGTYYYGACVDTVTGEADTANNCSSGALVTVSVAPDLMVESVMVSDSSPDVGGSFTLSATVGNGGDGPSPATTLRFYRSTDATITVSDTAVGTDAVGALAASGTSAQSISLTAPLSAGTYYYGACVDTVTGEADTANNCSSAALVTVSALATVGVAPDLMVESVMVSDSSPDGGGSFTLSATVGNGGDGPSPATTLRFYRSTDATISASDTAVGTDAVGALAASGTSAQSISLTAPLSAGTYYYGACVDTVTGEADTANNCSSGALVTVSVAPDLMVESVMVSDSSPDVGGSFTLSATVRNGGDGPSPATTLRFYRSTDATITVSDTAVGTDAVGALAASGTSAESISLTAPLSAGTYYYGACVDTVSGESDTANNCSSAVTVTVVVPDLLVESVMVSDSSPDVGGSFTLSATVRNGGDGPSPATTLRYYRSTDATISASR